MKDAKWGQPAAQVEASEEEIEFAPRPRREGSLHITERRTATFDASGFDPAPPAPYDAAQVEALIEKIRQPGTAERAALECAEGPIAGIIQDYFAEIEKLAYSIFRASRPVERRVEGWAVLNADESFRMALGSKLSDDAVAFLGGKAPSIRATITLHDAAREEGK